MNVYGIVEIEAGSNLKYECPNGDISKFVLDRVIPIRCPFSYGFIENTLGLDGDPLDVFIISNSIIPQKTFVNLNVLGMLEVIDNGVEDNKIIACINGSEENREPLNRIKEFLINYKKNVTVGKMLSKSEALKYIERYKHAS